MHNMYMSVIKIGTWDSISPAALRTHICDMYTHTDTPLPMHRTKELEKDYLTLF